MFKINYKKIIRAVAANENGEITIKFRRLSHETIFALAVRGYIVYRVNEIAIVRECNE